MSAGIRFERDLTAVLEDLYLGPSPDYRHEVLAVATARRQRPTWTFPGRWLPMADIASTRAVAPRVPWRTLTVALLVIALLLAAVVAFVGSRQTRVAPPFGVANNGLIAYAAEGDIFVHDRASDTTTAIATGPDTDQEPMYSLDGSRIAWFRMALGDAGQARHIVVASADGSGPVVVTPNPIPNDSAFEWAPDSRSLLVVRNGDTWLYAVVSEGAAGYHPPRMIATDAGMHAKPFRPPDGQQVLLEREVDGRSQLFLLDLQTDAELVLAESRPGAGMGVARWSADGSAVVFSASPEDDPDSERLFIAQADGSGTRQVTHAPGTWFDIEATWSPDGTRIAFTRYERMGPDDWQARPTGILDVATGVVTGVGPLARQVRSAHPSPYDTLASFGEGLFLEWSPDSRLLLAMPSEAAGYPVVIDVADGSWEVLDVVATVGVPTQAWQRAP